MEGRIIEVSAPARAGIIGNPTDMYGGTVISCTLDARATCRIEPADKLIIEVSGERMELQTTDDLRVRGDKLDIARAALNYVFNAQRQPAESGILKAAAPTQPKRFHLIADTEIPVQAGLAGSTALLTALIAALAALEDETFNRWQLAETVGYVEFHEMQVIGGYQDAYMAAFGGLNYMDFRDKAQLLHVPDEEVFATVEPLGSEFEELPLLVAHTGVPRHSGQVHKSARQRWEEGDSIVIECMEEIAQLAREGKQAMLNDDWETLGEVMNENHAIIRSLGSSAESNERLIKAALEGGAVGAKLAGAGGGGTIIALTLEPEETLQALKDAGAEQFLQLNPAAPGVQISIT